MRTAKTTGDSEDFNLVFEGGELAAVTLHTENSMLLKIYHRETEVCKASTIENIAHCQWYPAFSTQYKIRVSGLVESESVYTLIVN